jgi:dienelactone hydrolase
MLRAFCLAIILVTFVAAPSGVALATGADALPVEGFPELVRRPVQFWSDGTRLAGDVFHRKGLSADEKLPVIVLCHGWGGLKSHLNQAIAPRFADAGYLVLAFDYRGWGDSDSRLVLRDAMPKPDEAGYLTVKVQAIRDLVDPFDQQEDIDAAITFVEGETHADRERIGIWGSSFGAGHVIWRAAHDVRVKVVVSQVGGYQRSDLEGVAAQTAASHQNEIRRVRGELEPVPQTKPPGIPAELRGVPYMERIVEFRPGDVIDRIQVPVQILQAEKEHYFDPVQHGEWAYTRLRDRVPAEYHMLPGIGHYDIYRGEPLNRAMELEIAFFDKHLKPAP